MSRTLFYIFLFFYTLAVLYLASVLPIGPHEATVYYTDTYILHYLTHLCNGWFGDGLDFRFPFIFFGFLNIPLFFIMSRLYFENKKESYLSTMIFALLPGIIASSVLVNIAVFVITLVLGFITFYEKKKLLWQGVVMILLLFTHDASVIFFIAVAIFSAFKRNRQLFALSIVLAGISLFYFNGLDIGGKPQGEFLELFGLYISKISNFN